MPLARILCAAWLCLVSLASLAAPDFTDPAALQGWMSRYYLKREPALVGKAVLAASRHGLLADDRAASMFGFVAGVLNKDPQVARSLAAELRPLVGDEQSVLLLGIWYSGHPETKALLKDLEAAWPGQAEGIGAMLRGKKTRLENIALEEGLWVIDALWGDFSAGGDPEPVVRVISALRWIGPRANAGQLMLAGVAQKTLIEKAAAHPKVMAICVDVAATEPAEITGPLRAVIAAAKQRKPGGLPR